MSIKKINQLDTNEYTVVFTVLVFNIFLWQKTQVSISFKVHEWLFQLLDQALDVFKENQKLTREFQKLGRVFK